VNIVGDRRPEIIAPVPDGFVYAVAPSARRLWRYDYAGGAAKTFASEVVAADLNATDVSSSSSARMGRSEGPAASWCCRQRESESTTTETASARRPRLRSPTSTRRLEMVLTTFDHGIDVYRCPSVSGEPPGVAHRSRLSRAQRRRPGHRPLNTRGGAS
jgi:hypothetical protein